MKTHAGFKELVDKALEDVLADLAGDYGADNPHEAVVAQRGREEVASAEVARKDSRHIRRSSRHPAADDSQRTSIPAELSGIIDHNSALLAVAGAAVSADCDPCLDAVIPGLEGVGISKDDVRTAVESGRFPGAFPLLTAEMLERACAAAGEDGIDCAGS